MPILVLVVALFMATQVTEGEAAPSQADLDIVFRRALQAPQRTLDFDGFLVALASMAARKWGSRGGCLLYTSPSPRDS